MARLLNRMCKRFPQSIFSCSMRLVGCVSDFLEALDTVLEQLAFKLQGGSHGFEVPRFGLGPAESLHRCVSLLAHRFNLQGASRCVTLRDISLVLHCAKCGAQATRFLGCLLQLRPKACLPFLSSCSGHASYCCEVRWRPCSRLWPSGYRVRIGRSGGKCAVYAEAASRIYWRLRGSGYGGARRR